MKVPLVTGGDEVRKNDEGGFSVLDSAAKVKVAFSLLPMGPCGRYGTNLRFRVYWAGWHLEDASHLSKMGITISHGQVLTGHTKLLRIRM